jgi:hypothetical protein
MDDATREQEALAAEDLIREKVDREGHIWRKVYFGGGPHFRNWLDQTTELCGSENVEVEETDPKGLQCYEQGSEKVYRIWVKQSTVTDELT